MAGDDNIYGFDPSETASVIAVILFGFSTIYHCYQTWQYRAQFFVDFIIDGAMMTAGYIARCIFAQTHTELGPYVVQYLCLLLPPSLYAACIYMMYGRMVVLVEKPQLSLIAPHRVTKLFVLGDAIAFITQLAGGGTMASDGSRELGERVLIAGPVVQLLSFGLFFTTAFIFEMRLRKLMLFRERTLWRVLLYILFVAAGLIIADASIGSSRLVRVSTDIWRHMRPTFMSWMPCPFLPSRSSSTFALLEGPWSLHRSRQRVHTR